MLNEKLLVVLEDQQRIGQEVYNESLIIEELRVAAQNLSSIPQHPDATVTSTNLEAGVIAYGRNGKVVGELPVTDSILIMPEDYGINDVGYFYVWGLNENKKILEQNSEVQVSFPAEELGDATPEDVMEGKIFTSANGITLVGTATGGGNPPRAEENYF